jgi:hypothetical protein
MAGSTDRQCRHAAFKKVTGGTARVIRTNLDSVFNMTKHVMQ